MHISYTVCATVIDPTREYQINPLPIHPKSPLKLTWQPHLFLRVLSLERSLIPSANYVNHSLIVSECTHRVSHVIFLIANYKNAILASQAYFAISSKNSTDPFVKEK